MSWILGIDTSSTDLGIGLYGDTGPAASYSRFIKNSHAEVIAAAVSMVLNNSGVVPSGIGHIAVSAGPGSFTGLRIGIAFVKGFCLSSPAKVLPVSSLFILAHGGLGKSASIVAAVDARRDDVFWARFHDDGHGLARETPDRLASAVEFREGLLPGDAIVTDTMGYGRSSVFSSLAGRSGVFPVEKYPIQRGLHCAAAGASAIAGVLSESPIWHEAVEVLPRYLRSFPSPTIGGEA